MANYNVERKNYNRFTAQIAKNVVKKKILEIRARGARAADEMIDDIILKGQKNTRSRSLAEEIAPIIEKNRSKWRNFVMELAGRFDPEALAAVGVNLVYGGLMTASAGNVGWASVVCVEGKDSRKLAEILSMGRNRGNLVWILRGRETFSAEALKTCRYFPECAFLLVDNGKMNAESLQSIKNVAVLLKTEDRKGEKELLKRGIPYIFADCTAFSQEGRGELYSAPPRSVISFLEAPRYPIVIDDLKSGLDSIEYLLSNGKNRVIPYYFT